MEEIKGSKTLKNVDMTSPYITDVTANGYSINTDGYGMGIVDVPYPTTTTKSITLGSGGTIASSGSGSWTDIGDSTIWTTTGASTYYDSVTIEKMKKEIEDLQSLVNMLLEEKEEMKKKLREKVGVRDLENRLLGLEQKINGKPQTVNLEQCEVKYDSHKSGIITEVEFNKIMEKIKEGPVNLPKYGEEAIEDEDALGW